MKKIMLAKKGKRILARIIDLSIVFLFTILSFLFILYPITFDRETYDNNHKEIFELLEESDLYVVADNGNYKLKTGFSNIVTLEDLYSIDVSFENENYNIKITKSLYEFYTSKLESFSNLDNLKYENFCSSILKVGTDESNIKSFNLDNYQFELIDSTKPFVCAEFIYKQYENAGTIVASSSKVSSLNQANQKIMFDSILTIIPLLIIFSFIFDFLIPIFSKESQTVGKHLLGLIVLSKDGYHYKKSKHILRFITYVGIELIVGIITFGGAIMISYTLFMFKKNRRCLHDLVAGSIVADKKESFFFDNPVEERYYEERQKRRGIYNG